jgi:putrescine transport system substrate-binding protein
MHLETQKCREPAAPKVRLKRGAACVAFLFALLGCSPHGSPSNTGATTAAATGTSNPGPYDSEKLLNVYSWADYIAPDTVANFEKETGIKVRYDTYDNNEVLETKLLTGHTGYDVVDPTETFFERQMHAGVYRKLDKSLLTNYSNLDPEIMRRLAVHDPGNLYAVPYMWTTTGIGYNVAAVRARLGHDPPDSWAVLFDPASAAKLQDCGITVLDSPIDVFASAIIYLGGDPNRLEPRDVAAASELLRKIRPFIRNIDAVQYLTDLANGSVCLALGWSGDVEQARSRARESKTGVELAYIIPREGALITVDMMSIPADAPHPRNAQLWLNYLMRPDVMAGITNAIKYPNGNAAALPLVRAAIREDESIYPNAATRPRLVTAKAVPVEYSRLITREWTRFRTGY